jgi:hypothetical protein
LTQILGQPCEFQVGVDAREDADAAPSPPPLSEYRVLPQHLAPMVDETSVDGNFSAVPRGGFVGGGTQLPAGVYVAWNPAAAVPSVAVFGDVGVAVRLEDVGHPQQVNIAPVIGGVALLGEKGKVTAVSTFRFPAVAASSAEAQDSAGGLDVTVRGAVGESVTLFYATAGAAGKYSVQSKAVVVGPAGTTKLSLSANLESKPSLKTDDDEQQDLTGWVVVDMTGGALSASIAAGLINRHLKRPAAVVKIRDSDMPWLEEMQRQDPTARKTIYSNVSSVELQEVAVSLGAADGAVLFNESEQHSISTVVTLCGVHKALALADAHHPGGISIVFDARGKWPNALEASKYAIRELLPKTSRQAFVLQAPHVFVDGYLADLAVAGYGTEPTSPLFAVWPESPYSNPTVPSLCNESAPEWSLFGDLVEGKTADAHGWQGPGEVGEKMATMIGYHDKGPGAWAESINLCTPSHRTISLVGDLASNLAFHARAQPVVSLTQHPPKQVGRYDRKRTYIAIVNSDGDNMQIDQCRINDVQLSGMIYRAASCALPGAVCPPVAWTMSNRLKEIAPVILRWWYARATPSDSFLMGPSGFGYVYPGIMDRRSQTAFANATAAAGASLGMTGYTHWDWVSDFPKALPFLEDIARTGLEVAMVATVPDVYKPDIPDVIGGRLAIVKPTSVLVEGVGQWNVDDAGAPKGCDKCTIPPTAACPVCVQPNPSAASLAEKLLAIPKGEITYIYKIWSVNFTAVEALGKALQGTHVEIVDYRVLAQLVKEKDALRRASAAVRLKTDYELQAADRYTPAEPAGIVTTVLKGAGEQPEGPPSGASPSPNAYLTVFTNAAPHFRAFGPLGGSPCGKRVKTSVTAKAHNCRFATNAGPFDMKNGACDCGVYVSEGKVLGSGGFGGMFGVTQAGEWVLGTLDNATVAQLKVSYAVNAFAWLVRNGSSVITAKGGEIAPRTTIGTTKDGKLLILEVDGCEPKQADAGGACKYKLGRTSYDMAQMLVKYGAQNAINLDGGGSSTVVSNGSVINRPTSTDLWSVSIERAVTVISCIV